MGARILGAQMAHEGPYIEFQIGPGYAVEDTRRALFIMPSLPQLFLGRG